MHFSVALAGFVRSQVVHFHPPCSEGGFIPAAPQLNPPPVPLLLVVGVGPGPGKVGVNPDPEVFDAPNENPDEVVDADEVELDVPNRKGPEGGAGIEKPFPEPGPEEDVPGLGVSHTVHFSLADAGFIRSHAPQVHPFVLVVGGFNPAAPQLNPPEPELVEVVVVVVVGVLPEPKRRGVEGGFGMENDGVEERFSTPGFGVSHTVHFSLADAGFMRSQVSHFQPSVSVIGGFNWAAPQLNPPKVEPVVVVATPGLGVSHTVHFSVAEVGFIRSQVPHFHPSSCFSGSFKPAAPQLNPPLVEAEVVVEEPGAWLDVEVGRAVVLVLGPALWEMNGTAEVGETFQPSSVGISSSANPLTSFSALSSPELLPSLIVLLGNVNVSEGSSETMIESASALASLGEVGAVGDTEDAEEAASSLSALMLNRNLEGSLGADDLRPKNVLPPMVGETVGAEEEAPFKPVVCN
jgi:hypothetical protein